jgi:hypothetical protein
MMHLDGLLGSRQSFVGWGLAHEIAMARCCYFALVLELGAPSQLKPLSGVFPPRRID